MIRNNVGAGRPSYGGDWQAFDRLPPIVRNALNEAVVSWDARERWKEFKFKTNDGGDPNEITCKMVEQIKEDDHKEVQAFRYHWPSRFGPGTPHIQAGATIMRYDEAALQRRKCGRLR